MNKKGFTLIELLVVVLIIGVLAAIALPMYSKAVTRTRAMEAVTLLRSLGEAQKRFFLEHSAYATKFTDLDISLPSEMAVCSSTCDVNGWSFSLPTIYGPRVIATPLGNKSSKMPLFRYNMVKTNNQIDLGCVAILDTDADALCKAMGGKLVSAASGDSKNNYYQLP